MQDEAVDDAEDGGVAADAERERENRDGGKAWTPRQLPARVAQVLSKCIHRAAPGTVTGTRRQALPNRAGSEISSGSAGVAHRAERAAVPRLCPLGGNRLEDLGAVATPELIAVREQQQAPQPPHVRLALRSRACARA